MVFNRCKKLRSLKMACCNQVSASVLCELATQLTGLTHLDLRGTAFNDQGCAILGQYCHQLQDLNLTMCSVTDNGIASLCVTFPNDQKKCPHLRKLDLSNTVVSTKGATDILTNIPNIQFLGHPTVFLAIGFLHHGKFIEGEAIPTIPPEQQYQLRNLILEDNRHDPINRSIDWLSIDQKDIERSIPIALAYCPLITDLSVRLCVTHKLWKDLQSLTDLKSITIADEFGGDFDTCILPILQKCGENIHLVELEYIENMDMDLIGALCPKLKTLTINQSNFNENGFVRNSHPEILRARGANRFSELDYLHMSFDEEYDEHDFHIADVLKFSKRLRNLTLFNVQAFSDSALHEVLDVNPLARLETLSVLHCTELTAEVIFRLLRMENDLYSLTLRGSPNITRRDFDEMKKLVKRENFNLKILWD